MKTLYVGDPHFKHTQKDELERLMRFVDDTAVAHDVEQIVILGDLNDNHGILRTDNQVFWEKWLNILSGKQSLFVLVGNHDMKNQGNDDDKENSLSVYNLMDDRALHIIQSPVKFGIFGYMPYIHDKKRFVEEANALAEQGTKVLVCHGEFDGAAYDNGFFIPDGVKQEDLNFDLIISGHIHSRAHAPPRDLRLPAAGRGRRAGLLRRAHAPRSGSCRMPSVAPGARKHAAGLARMAGHAPATGS